MKRCVLLSLLLMLGLFACGPSPSAQSKEWIGSTFYLDRQNGWEGMQIGQPLTKQMTLGRSIKSNVHYYKKPHDALTFQGTPLALKMYGYVNNRLYNIVYGVTDSQAVTKLTRVCTKLYGPPHYAMMGWPKWQGKRIRVERRRGTDTVFFGLFNRPMADSIAVADSLQRANQARSTVSE
jgi:hypothetical protein